MEKNISKNWVFYIDQNPAYDEYPEEAIGLFWFGWCLAGVLVNKRQRSFGIVFLNHAVGFWNDRGEDRE